MKVNNTNSRRSFITKLGAGFLAGGLALFPESLKASVKNESLKTGKEPSLDLVIKQVGKKEHPVAFDTSQAIPYGFIWSNVYFKTNKDTGTPENKLGVLVVLRHGGIIFALNDETIKKFRLGERTKLKDPKTKKVITNNPYYDIPDNFIGRKGFTGIKGLQEKGAVFCVCDMALQSTSAYVAKKMNLDADDVYKEIVAGILPGIYPAPSGVWALGRLAENNISYIDASVA
ncbi:hypothetical protein GCM10011416_15520 [Polaribacter pacificus]|uniref:Uncharacterized protein n=1 Tax=Polaribacter pacificus TaxID=1775173 RepID=A0A917MFX4_9FLAO|nr:hypothetical protein [Polaribacter pacificus]GGG98321.1 hypothetical protein GCM10011416_15520 [Polaribacter pacificus]